MNNFSDEEIEELKIRRQALQEEEDNLIQELTMEYLEEEEEEPSAEVVHMDRRESKLDEIAREMNILDERIGEYRRNKFLQNNIRKINSNFNISINEDYLNRKELAEIIGNSIIEQEGNSKLSIGILGEWGSGKSTFVNFIEEEIKNDNIVIKFNASKYDDQEQIWYSLLNTVSDKFLSQKKKFKRVKFLIESIRTKKEVGITLFSIITPIVFVTITSVFFEYLQNSKDFLNNLGFFQRTIGILMGVLSAFTGILSIDLLKKLYKNVRKYFNTNKEKISEQLKYPDYKKYLGTRENVRQDLIIFKKLLLKFNKNKRGKNIVVIVDELDRCSDNTIKNFFSSIEAFIDIPDIIFLFSINPEIVYPVVAEVIPDGPLSEEINKSKKGALFIEKYINLFVTLPVCSDYTKFMEKLFGDIIVKEDIENLTKLINTIAYHKKISPREIKKLLDLMLVYQFYFEELTFLEFATVLVTKNYYINFLNLFSNITKHSKSAIENFKISKEIRENSGIPEDVISQVLILLKEVNMYSLNKSMKKIERILLFT